MAQYGAHVTATVNDSHTQPSIFEVIAQESLLSSIQPAVKYVLRVLAEKNPAKFGWLFSYSEELHLLMQLVLENYYLKHYNASFAENFYGMKRIIAASSTKTLPAKTRLQSLLFIVLLPYVKTRCDHHYENLQHAPRQRSDKLRSAFLSLYPVLHMAWDSVMLLFQMAYMFHRSRHHSPWLRLAGVRLSYRDGTDVVDPHTSTPLTLSNWPGWLFGWIASRAGNGLTISIFLLQFLQWWYTDDRGRAVPLATLPTPPPPVVTSSLHAITPGRCPLCNEHTTNHTVLPASGYVFCYPCIFNYVTRNGRCPISHYPVLTDSLIKLHT